MRTWGRGQVKEPRGWGAQKVWGRGYNDGCAHQEPWRKATPDSSEPGTFTACAGQPSHSRGGLCLHPSPPPPQTPGRPRVVCAGPPGHGCSCVSPSLPELLLLLLDIGAKCHRNAVGLSANLGMTPGPVLPLQLSPPPSLQDPRLSCWPACLSVPAQLVIWITRGHPDSDLAPAEPGN